MEAVNSPVMHDKRLGDVRKGIVVRRAAEGKDGGSRGDAGHLLAHAGQMGTYGAQNGRWRKAQTKRRAAKTA